MFPTIIHTPLLINYCYFCPGDQSNTQIQRHLRDSHTNEIEVLKASNEKYKKDEILRISMLRQTLFNPSKSCMMPRQGFSNVLFCLH